MNKLIDIENEQIEDSLKNKDIPSFKSGDTVRVNVFVTEGNKLIKAASAHITNLQQTIGFIDLRIREEYRDYFENLAGSFEAVVEQYRTSNKEARDTDAPSYFQDKIEFSWRPLDDQSQRMKVESQEFTKVKSSAEVLLQSWPDIQSSVRNIRKEY